MTYRQKQAKIKKLVKEMLKNSHDAMVKKIDSALDSGALDIDNWTEDNAPMVIPKIIITVLLEREANQYSCKGTSYEKEIKKEIDNLKYFI